MHTLDVSPSGGGKTVSFLEPNALYTKCNAVYRSNKRSFVEKYTPNYLKNKCRVFDLNLAHPEMVNPNSVAYDPMVSVTDESSVYRLAEQIVNLDDTRNTTAEPYWASASKGLLSALIFLKLAEDNRANFAQVLDLFDELTIADSLTDSAIEISLNDRFEWLEMKAPTHPAVQAWRAFATLPYRTAACVYGTLASVLQNFTKPFRDAIRNLPAFRTEDFCKEKSVLFITANATDTSRFKLSNLFFEDLIHSLIDEAEINGGTLPYKTSLFIDDFGVGGVIEAVPAALSFVREAGISMNLLCQSLSQLNTMYGEAKATTIRNNCDNTIYIGAPNDLVTANEMALRLNRPVGDMMTLREDQVLVCRRGCPPEIVERYRTLEDPLYIETTVNYMKSPTVQAHTPRKVRKDFSPKQGTLESLRDLSKEVDALSAKFDQRYKQLTGSSFGETKKKKTAKSG
jgi:type IV secretory pathway TraG/TraD family ATPase VirD4